MLTKTKPNCSNTTSSAIAGYPTQSNDLPFLIKNETKPPNTHTTTDRLIIGTFTNSHHLQLIQNFTFQSKNFNILAFATSNSDPTSNKVFGCVGGISTLYANMSNYTFNFKQFWVMSVGFPLFMQTLSTNFMHAIRFPGLSLSFYSSSHCRFIHASHSQVILNCRAS